MNYTKFGYLVYVAEDRYNCGCSANRFNKFVEMQQAMRKSGNAPNICTVDLLASVLQEAVFNSFVESPSQAQGV